MTDYSARRHQERVERARLTPRPAPVARSHAERMTAARGIRLHDGDLRFTPSDRRRIIGKRNGES